MIEDVIKDAEIRMTKAQQVLERELGSIRTGRAATSLLDRIVVDHYGSQMPVNQLATIATPEAHLITIQPWDKGALTSIEKAIQKSDLGLNPSNDGQIIRLAVPPLTEERRKEFVKQVHKRVEDGRIAIRNVRRDASEKLKQAEKAKEIGQDDHRRASERLEKVTHQKVEEVDSIGQKKEADLMVV